MSLSTDRHDTCKFGFWEPIGTHSKPANRVCTNSHCNKLVKKMQCVGCGYYAKRDPSKPHPLRCETCTNLKCDQYCNRGIFRSSYDSEGDMYSASSFTFYHGCALHSSAIDAQRRIHADDIPLMECFGEAYSRDDEQCQICPQNIYCNACDFQIKCVLATKDKIQKERDTAQQRIDDVIGELERKEEIADTESNRVAPGSGHFEASLFMRWCGKQEAYKEAIALLRDGVKKE